MAYIIQPTIKSNLDIGGKIVPWNEQEVNKLIKEKEEYLAHKREQEVKTVKESKVDDEVEKEEKEEKVEIKKEYSELKNKKSKGQVKDNG